MRPLILHYVVNHLVQFEEVEDIVRHRDRILNVGFFRAKVQLLVCSIFGACIGRRKRQP